MTLATTVDALIERVRRDAMLGVYGPYYSLAEQADPGETMLIVNEAIEHITRGSLLGVGTEMMRVTEAHHGTNQLEVARAQFGSTEGTHPIGTMVEQDPRFPKASLLDWAELEIRSWNKLLFRIVTASLPVVRTERTYDLDVEGTGIDFLLDVRSEPVNVPVDDFGSTWTGDSWPKVEAKLLRDMPLADFPSGFALQLLHFPRYAADLRVAYAAPFNLAALTGATDLVSTVGLDAAWFDILENGLRWRLLNASITARSDWRATGVNRESQDVSLLDLVRAVDMARSMRDRRLNEEAVNLRSKYAYKSR